MSDARQELLDNFNHFDRDSDGSIDFQEFSLLMDGLQADLSDEELTIGFESIDADGSGKIDFEEFARWLGARVKKWAGVSSAGTGSE